jgi:hypothetical protein
MSGIVARHITAVKRRVGSWQNPLFSTLAAESIARDATIRLPFGAAHLSVSEGSRVTNGPR